MWMVKWNSKSNTSLNKYTCSESMVVVLPNGDEFFCFVNTPVCTSFPFWAAHLFRWHFNSLKLDCKLNCHNTVDVSIISWCSVDTWLKYVYIINLFCFHTARIKNNKLNLGLLSHLQVRLILEIRAWIIANLSYSGNFHIWDIYRYNKSTRG